MIIIFFMSKIDLIVQFPNSVLVTTLLDRPSKFCCEVRKYGQDFEFGNYPLERNLRQNFAKDLF